jgi:hypothetical protein
MTIVTHKLDLAYEAELDRAEYPAREEGRVIDDAAVEGLLLGVPERGAQRDRDHEPVPALEAADEGDELAGMRGLMIGFALAALLWGFIAAIFLMV